MSLLAKIDSFLATIERLLGLRTNRSVFFPGALAIFVFVPLSMIFNEQVGEIFGALSEGIATYFGWYYILACTLLLIFLIAIASGRTGEIRLGPDDSTPEYGDVAWFTMLFAAGIGTVLMFWGVAEPISHLTNPPFEGVEPGSVQAAKDALNFAFYHFGLHTWAIFATPGLAVAYFVYRKDLPLRFSSVFEPLLGKRINGPIGSVIDTVAVVGTLFGVATSLSLGTLQIMSGLEYLFGAPNEVWVKMVIIVVVTAMATTSVVMGLDAGIKRLSEFNILLAVVLMLFVFATGPTVFILQGMVEGIGNYLGTLPKLAFWNDAFADDGWQQKWTIFYWAWTASWAPFVGIFVARISYGRTIREFVWGVLLAPTAFSIVWFSVFGLSALDIELNRGGGLAPQVHEDVAVAIYSFLEHFPLSQLSCGLALVIVVIFFTTSSDSASLVVDMLSTDDASMGPVKQRVFWAVSEGGIAAALLFADSFEALSNVITTLAFPFSAMLVAMSVAVWRSARKELE